MKSNVIFTILSISLFLLNWEIFYWSIIRDPFLLAPPSRVVPTFIRLFIGQDPSFYMPLDVLYSLYHYAIGFSVAVVFGVSLGLLMGYLKTIEKIIAPTIELLRPIPPIAWIPISILLLKLTHVSAGFIIFIGAFFPILLNTRHGVANVELKFLEAGITLGADEFNLLRKVIIPGAIPSIFTGIRVGSGVAWMCVVAAELFGVSAYGLGYQIEIARLYHAPEIVISYMLSIGLIGYVLDRMYKFLENRLLKWRRGLVVE
ncbi:MAG: ABC transporter permease [Archaeoglobaceae archaeon]|nr:ABC transporter permease [Archaeoglobaceae archaeon]